MDIDPSTDLLYKNLKHLQIAFLFYMQMDDFGKAPILCEVIEAEIALKTSVSNLVVWAVNAEGIFVGNVPVKYEDGWAKFTLGKKYPSIYYLIQAE